MQDSEKRAIVEKAAMVILDDVKARLQDADLLEVMMLYALAMSKDKSITILRKDVDHIVKQLKEEGYGRPLKFDVTDEKLTVALSRRPSKQN